MGYFLHGTYTEYDDERDYYEMLFGRGPGDPDVYGYPGQDDEEQAG